MISTQWVQFLLISVFNTLHDIVLYIFNGVMWKEQSLGLNLETCSSHLSLETCEMCISIFINLNVNCISYFQFYWNLRRDVSV